MHFISLIITLVYNYRPHASAEGDELWCFQEIGRRGTISRNAVSKILKPVDRDAQTQARPTVKQAGNAIADNAPLLEISPPDLPVVARLDLHCNDIRRKGVMPVT
jgi:hypothetical protein